jgi:hypothetical protein
LGILISFCNAALRARRLWNEVEIVSEGVASRKKIFKKALTQFRVSRQKGVQQKFAAKIGGFS